MWEKFESVVNTILILAAVIGFVVLFGVCAKSAHADTTVYYISPATVVRASHSRSGDSVLQPLCRTLYDTYVENRIWIVGNQFSICKITAPDNIITEINSLGWNRITETEVVSGVAIGYPTYGELRTVRSYQRSVESSRSRRR